MTPEEIAEVERPVPMGPGAVWTLTDQKGRLLAEVKRLRAVVDQTIAACSGHLGGLTDELAGAEADRDRARDAAVALEQENARLAEELGQLRLDDETEQRATAGVYDEEDPY